jgi:hypothetical protein
MDKLSNINKIQKMFQSISSSERLQYYNTAIEMNEDELAQIMLDLIEKFDRFENKLK